MRKFGNWQGHAIKTLRKAWGELHRNEPDDEYRLNKHNFSLIVSVELALTALTLLDCSEPEAIPALVSRYGFHRLSRFQEQFPYEDTEFIIANLSQLLSQYLSQGRWKDALEDYMEGDVIPQQIRYFDVWENEEGQYFQQRGSSIVPERYSHYVDTLVNPIPFQQRKIKDSIPGVYAFDAYDRNLKDHKPYTVEVTADMIDPLPNKISIAEEGLHSQEPISIPWTELRETARWMDTQIAENSAGELDVGNWEGRISGVQYTIFQNGELSDTDHIVLDNVSNIVGMVSSGKSTLMHIIAVWAARHSLRIVLVLETVVEITRWVVFFQALGLNATGIIGNSGREKHLTKLHRLKMYDFRNPTNPMLHSGGEFDLLSTACALQDHVEELDTPLEPKDYPCNMLKLSDDNQFSYSCPYWKNCSTTLAARNLLESNIWITTIYGLLYKSIPPQLADEYATHLELTYRLSDIVIIDEADRVQVTLDSEATLADSLIGEEGSFLSRLQRRVQEELDREQQNQLSIPALSTWKSQLSQLEMATTQSIAMLKQNKRLQQHIGDAPFSPWVTFNELAKRLTNYRERDNYNQVAYDELRQRFFNFVLSPLRVEAEYRDTSSLVDIAKNMVSDLPQMSGRDKIKARGEHQKYLTDLPLTEDSVSDDSTLLFEFSIWISIMSDMINRIISNWEQVERLLNLSDTDPSAFRGSSRELLAIIPPAPMGNIVAFQHKYDKRQSGRGGLRFLRYQGVGRALLTDLRHLLAGDQLQSPHIVLLSATSWSGASYGYHISHEITGILNAPQAEVDAIYEGTEMIFDPLFDQENRPIFVSGAGSMKRRSKALDTIAWRLSKQAGLGPNQQSQLERILSELPENRQNILLVVGSYADAQKLRDSFYKRRPEWKENNFVDAIVSDDPRYHADGSIHEGIQRGVMQHLDAMEPSVFIAPIWAIERGHNILNENNEAALGAVMFLVRPHPHPDDLMPLMLRMNRWAMETSKDEQELVNLMRQYGNIDEPITVSDFFNVFNRKGRALWYKMNSRIFAYSMLEDDDRYTFIWQHLVIIIQIIGRLVRGGVPARVYFSDAAFAPLTATGFGDNQWEHEDINVYEAEIRQETEMTSLLIGFYRVLAPYFDESSRDMSNQPITDVERNIVRILYGPFFEAFRKLQGVDL